MSSQHAMPFYESAEDATQHAIRSSGKAPKAIASALWPSLAQASAYARLMNALNPDKAEKLTADEHAFIAEFCGQFDFLHYLAHRLSHSRPEPVAPEDQHARLQREFVAAVQHLSVLQKQLDVTGSRLRSVA